MELEYGRRVLVRVLKLLADRGRVRAVVNFFSSVGLGIITEGWLEIDKTLLVSMLIGDARGVRVPEPTHTVADDTTYDCEKL